MLKSFSHTPYPGRHFSLDEKELAWNALYFFGSERLFQAIGCERNAGRADSMSVFAFLWCGGETVYSPGSRYAGKGENDNTAVCKNRNFLAQNTSAAFL